MVFGKVTSSEMIEYNLFLIDEELEWITKNKELKIYPGALKELLVKAINYGRGKGYSDGYKDGFYKSKNQIKKTLKEIILSDSNCLTSDVISDIIKIINKIRVNN